MNRPHCRRYKKHRHTIVDSLLTGLSWRFSLQWFTRDYHRFASRRSITMLQLATVRASLSLVHFSPVRRNASARNSSRLTVIGLSRCFSSQWFVPHRCQFASRRSVATLQLTTVRASPSPIRFSPVYRNASARNDFLHTICDDSSDASVLRTIGDASPSTQPVTLHLPPNQRFFAFRYFFFSFWVNFFVNFCLMILVPLGIFV